MIDNVLPIISTEDRFKKLKGNALLILCGDFIYIGLKVETMTYILGWYVEERLIPRKFKNKYDAMKKVDLKINLQNAIEVSKNDYDFRLLEAVEKLMLPAKIRTIYH